MLRDILEIGLPLLLPTALYLFWVGALKPLLQNGATGAAAPPWLWLGGVGIVLLAVVLVAFGGVFGSPQTGAYVPPHLEGGRIVPGHFEPARR